MASRGKCAFSAEPVRPAKPVEMVEGRSIKAYIVTSIARWQSQVSRALGGNRGPWHQATVLAAAEHATTGSDVGDFYALPLSGMRRMLPV